MAEKRKPGGAKTSRSETVTVRLDPKLRYLAELAARIQRRTLSSFIEWAVDGATKSVMLPSPYDGSEPVSVDSAAGMLWQVDEPHRLARLALGYPNLLTFEEQRLWQLCKNVVTIYAPSVGATDKELADAEFLRRHWDVLVASAAAGADVGEVVRIIGPPERLPAPKKK